MFDIKYLEDVHCIKVKITKDTSINLKEELILPGTFLKGDKWIFYYQCLKCKNTIESGEAVLGFKQIGYLSISRIPNKSLLDNLGNIFHLNLFSEIDENGFESHYYSLTGKYKPIALAGYFHCQHCNAQYLMAYYIVWGESDRYFIPDKVYIEKILHVSFDHELFLKLLSEK